MSEQVILAILAFVCSGLALFLAMRFAGVMILCGGALAGCFGYVYARTALSYGVSAGLAATVAFVFLSARALTFFWGRLRRESFELASLAAAILAEELFKQLPGITGGVWGLGKVPAPFQTLRHSSAMLASLCALLSIACFAAAHRVSNGRLRDAALFRLSSRLHAESIGLSTRQSHGFHFLTVTAALAAVGLFSVWSLEGIHPDSFGLSLDLSCLMAGVLFGRGSGDLVVGAIYCASFATFAEFLRFLRLPTAAIGNVQQIIYGGALLYLLLNLRMKPAYVKT